MVLECAVCGHKYDLGCCFDLARQEKYLLMWLMSIWKLKKFLKFAEDTAL